MITQFLLGAVMVAVGIIIYRQKDRISDPTGVIMLGIILTAIGATLSICAFYGIPLW